MTRRTLARALAARVDRLRETFAALDAAVREKVAEIAGKAVADAVRHAVRAALDAAGPPAEQPQPDDDLWGDEETRRLHEPNDDWPPPARIRPDPGSLPRAAAAVLAGCRTAAWWLARSAGKPGWGWVAAGLAAGAIAYACGPIAAAVLPAAAALALAARAAAVADLLPARFSY